MAVLSRLLFALARSWVGAWIIGWSFAHMSELIPVDRVYETELVLAFHHPKPSHQTHILIVPKQPLLSLMEINEVHAPILQDVISVAQRIVSDLALEQKGFRLTVNGGAYQDVAQVHWHLISDG
jgi:histidine triad (HIT) family protein